MAAPLSPNLPWNLANPLWAQTLNPVLALAILSGQPMNGIVLKNGTVTVPHSLGRPMVGFIQTDINAAATYYRSAPFNGTTLTLTSNAVATLNLWIY